MSGWWLCLLYAVPFALNLKPSPWVCQQHAQVPRPKDTVTVVSVGLLCFVARISPCVLTFITVLKGAHLWSVL